MANAEVSARIADLEARLATATNPYVRLAITNQLQQQRLILKQFPDDVPGDGKLGMKHGIGDKIGDITNPITDVVEVGLQATALAGAGYAAAAGAGLAPASISTAPAGAAGAGAAGSSALGGAAAADAATKAALIESGTVGAAGAALELSAVGATPWASTVGGTSAAAAGATGGKAAGITASDVMTGLSAASMLAGPKMPELPTAEDIPTREEVAANAPKTRTEQFATREQNLRRAASAAGATRSENEADLLGMRPSVKKRGPARRVLSGY